MPFINIKMTAGATKEQKSQIVREFTDTMVRVLGKNPQNTHIVIDEIERENWGQAGLDCSAIGVLFLSPIGGRIRAFFQLVMCRFSTL